MVLQKIKFLGIKHMVMQLNNLIEYILNIFTFNMIYNILLNQASSCLENKQHEGINELITEIKENKYASKHKEPLGRR